MNTKNLPLLKIHKLTQAQYDREFEAGRLDEDALYLTPDEKVSSSDYYTKEEIDATLEELSESVVSKSEEFKIVDDDSNVIFSVDADGAHTTSLTLNGETVEDIIEDRVASLVDSAPETLDTLHELASALGDDPNFAATIAEELGKKVEKVEGKGLSTNDFTDEYKNKLDSVGTSGFEESDPTVPAWAKNPNPPTYTAEDVGALPSTTPLFSGDYNDLTNAPNIVEDGSGNLIITDASGNIIFRSDGNGFETTTLAVQNMIINNVGLQEYINTLIQSATTNLLTREQMEAYVEETILGGEW